MSVIIFVLGIVLLLQQVVHATNITDTNQIVCTESCLSFSCFPHWWSEANAKPLALIFAALLVFLATFLPKVLVRVGVFVATKLPFIHQIAKDYHRFCAEPTANLVATLLIYAALVVSKLLAFLCNIPLYIIGVFILIWMHSLFHVLESLIIRRMVGVQGDSSKKMVISETVKILRLTMLLVMTMIIYSASVDDPSQADDAAKDPFFSTQGILKYSVVAAIGLAIALGFVPSFHNVVGGLFLAFNSQFRINDFVDVGNAQGFVHEISLRYTTVVTTDGTKVYIPNSFFLYKPMVNFTQRPKREIDLQVRVASTTTVDQLRKCLKELERMLHSLHVSLTSHDENFSDMNHGERKWDRFFFVAMEELHVIRVYTYTDELDNRKYSMIKSEVWLMMMEILEQLDIEIVVMPDMLDSCDMRFTTRSTTRQEQVEIESPFHTEMSKITGMNADSYSQRTRH